MATGLKVWNASGGLVIDTSFRTARLIDIIDYSFPSVSGSVPQVITIPITDIVNDGTWAALAMGVGHSAKIYSGYVEINATSSYRQISGRLLVVRF